MSMFRIEMKTKVKDNITGFEGVVTARCEYITGCKQYLVTAKGKSNKIGDSNWFDEDRLQGNKTTLWPRTNGGPQQYAPRV